MSNIREPDTCPADVHETAEAYMMETLSQAEARHFEDHCITCSDCALAAEETEQYVSTMRAAAQKLRTATQIILRGADQLRRSGKQPQ